VATVTMPQLGESVAEGTVGRWLKKPGDRVLKDEALLEVVTDKVDAEVPSPFEGILTEILVAEGATVPNGADLAIITTADEPAVVPAAVPAPDAPAASRPVPAPTDAPAPAAPPVALPTPASAPAAVVVPVAIADEAPSGRMAPAVRRLLREHGLSGAGIAGSGLGGRITRADVLAFVAAGGSDASAPATPAASLGPVAPASAAAVSPARTAPASPVGSSIVFPPGADEVVVPLSQMRRGIAAQMTRALAVPHAYVHVEVDVSGLVRLRAGAKAAFQEREGLPLSYVPFVVKACVAALRRQPAFNAHWTEQGLVAKRRINVGVAVAVGEGLIVPVVRDVDQMSIAGLNRAIAEVAARARAGRLRLDDFGGGTFTVDNTGWLGSNLTMPIVNVPEVAIVTMEQIIKRPVVVETPEGDVIAIRSMMNMVIGFDHRANDGAAAGAFLRDVKVALEAIGPETPLY
jgi:2-oxoisovalerate dehydrogenase E2 component (dihydrolipoyl transacylase)